MMKNFASIICVLIAFALSDAEAYLGGTFRTNLTFSASSMEHVGATWSDSLLRGEKGLYPAPKPSDYGWIQTARIPVGIAWRPPTSSTAGIRIYGDGITDDQSLSAYVRYGCDGVHWSTWIPMIHGSSLGPLPKSKSESSVTNATEFSAHLRIPRDEQELYLKLKEDEWRKTDPDWDSDQDAYSRWLLEKDPLFFRDNLPFLGYVQFRLEFNQLRQEQPCVIRSITILGSWWVGGLHQRSKSGNYPSKGKRWNLLLDKNEELPNQRVDPTLKNAF